MGCCLIAPAATSISELFTALQHPLSQPRTHLKSYTIAENDSLVTALINTYLVQDISRGRLMQSISLRDYRAMRGADCTGYAIVSSILIVFIRTFYTQTSCVVAAPSWFLYLPGRNIFAFVVS